MRAFSAGNTRGLIEADRLRCPDIDPHDKASFPRGIPAASLKRQLFFIRTRARSMRVFRGEYPRPH